MVFEDSARARGSKRSGGSQSNTLSGLSASFKATVLSEGDIELAEPRVQTSMTNLGDMDRGSAVPILL